MFGLFLSEEFDNFSFYLFICGPFNVKGFSREQYMTFRIKAQNGLIQCSEDNIGIKLDNVCGSVAGPHQLNSSAETIKEEGVIIIIIIK